MVERNSGLRFEPLESRQLLAVLTPNPLVTAGFVGSDLVITGSAPEIHIKITEVGTPLPSRVSPRTTSGRTGTPTRSRRTSTILAHEFRRLHADLAARPQDQAQRRRFELDVGDVADPVTVGRDLIVSMPASTTSANLSKAGIGSTSHLCIDIDSTTSAAT